MFFHIAIEQNVDLEPQYFGPSLRKTIGQKITEKVEGTCSGNYGYIVCVTAITEISKGKIRSDGSGLATFKVKFGCVTFRPFKGEVLDCIVTSVNKMGFFAEAGPLQIFVSSHLIPEDYEYSSANDAAYVSRQDGVRIEERAEFCIGTINEDFLGVIT
ncbi:DNA-directed RNA polymerase II subunit RPB7 [Monoraphidium neglectum]|uniref:DNA-directed RNA polymerase II subunit RPB7 n=1 Tax=Monoraphidium neglectum TaxID=145388 RepID=A0A0D2L704_9CHLO|nr:DNA-directed RNA polymerase II subunit RPB7 [Monoraphidium neglectum]KIZ02639.1 DNA-directed RNA polymerase II subunit RPB7 [Monoraphidium neglectum]|eukprot:XP_013901658.1 DNA-directed RNA polymerase II subunit RPB7 [Monoraphidium neglectum]